ncbi:MAG: hypothetical protein IPL78_26635 [Chloroflexi bacterium]|nr:hypothetical protein [Chloroflexota bacterium]
MSVKKLVKGELAPDSLVYSATGQPVHTSELWADGPVLLTFLRHFG